jgi:hypothetical protein
MNPWHLSASDLLIWGLVLHLIADWPLQNDWMANNKAKRWVDKDGDGVLRDRKMQPTTYWWLRHPAAWVHAGIHTVMLALVFGWPAIFLGLVHLIIDTRTPVVWWSQLVKQTQPKNRIFYQHSELYAEEVYEIPVYDIGLEVRFWTDQVFHIACIAVAAFLMTL